MLSEGTAEMLEVRERFQFAMPPVGISVTRIQLSGVVYESHTARCDAEGCWMVYYKPERAEAERFLDDHKNGVKYPNGERGWPKCPSWPMRELLPSGLSNLEKLWNEMDDVVDAILESTSYQDMEGDALRSYAQGIAFSIVMLDGHFFKNKLAVSAHARDRWKMRRGVIPYASTPTRYRQEYTVHSSGEFTHSSVPGKKVIAGQSNAAQAKPSARPVARAPKTEKTLTQDQANNIKAGLESGMFSIEDLAEMYKVSPELVKQVST